MQLNRNDTNKYKRSPWWGHGGHEDVQTPERRRRPAGTGSVWTHKYGRKTMGKHTCDQRQERRVLPVPRVHGGGGGRGLVKHQHSSTSYRLDPAVNNQVINKGLTTYKHSWAPPTKGSTQGVTRSHNQRPPERKPRHGPLLL